MFKNIGNILQHAKDLKQKLADVEVELNQTFVTGYSTSNLVEVIMNCKGDFSSVKIDDVTLKDKEMLERLMLEALKDAREKANSYSKDAISKATGGLDIPPGILPF